MKFALLHGHSFEMPLDEIPSITKYENEKTIFVKNWNQRQQVSTSWKYKDQTVNVWYPLFACVLVNTTRDFDPFSNETQIVDDTSSYQFRPKTLYKSSKGVYYKHTTTKKAVYLTPNQEAELWELVNYHQFN